MMKVVLSNTFDTNQERIWYFVAMSARTQLKGKIAYESMLKKFPPRLNNMRIVK